MTSWRAYLPLGYANEPFHWPLMEPESRPKEREFCSDTSNETNKRSNTVTCHFP